MKNLILAAVSASALLALSACGDADDDAADTTVVATETVEPAPMATETAVMDPAADAAVDAAGDTADATVDAAEDTADAAGDAADAAAQ